MSEDQAANIFVLCVSVCALIVVAFLIWKEYDNDVTLDDLINKHRAKNKRKIVKELAKLNKKPDFIMCEPYHLEAMFDDMITNIIGIPIIYSHLSGKPYVFVWFNDDLKKLNEQCEKILKENKK